MRAAPLMVQKQLPLGGPARTQPGLAPQHGPLWATLRASHCPCWAHGATGTGWSPEAQPEHEAHRARLWVPRRVALPAGPVGGWEPSGAPGMVPEVHARGVRVSSTGLVCAFMVPVLPQVQQRTPARGLTHRRSCRRSPVAARTS